MRSAQLSSQLCTRGTFQHLDGRPAHPRFRPFSSAAPQCKLPKFFRGRLHGRAEFAALKTPAAIMRRNAGASTVRTMASSSGGDLFLGMDFGTSGARAIIINSDRQQVAEASQPYSDPGPDGWADTWKRALFANLAGLDAAVLARVRAVAIDGTSATAMLVDAASGKSLAEPKLYNEQQPAEALAAVQAIAPEGHTVRAATSTLSKLLAWKQDGTLEAAAREYDAPCLLHQADWLAGLLHGRWDTSDWNNALKLGFDPGAERYPDWLASQEFARWLPRRVVAPGSGVATVTANVAQRTGLSPNCIICAGTTDGNAAFVAAGVEAGDVGAAVTSLGSTMAIKLVSDVRIDDASHGLYSHRLGDSWLVGGASNVGGAVLRQFFTDEQLVELTKRIDTSKSPSLGYYPLPRPGERFPVNDPGLQPVLTPRPDDDAVFLHGILEGIADVEARAYTLLREMGASPLTKVYTAGGGAKNDKWTAMRAAKLGVPVEASPHSDAAYGSSLLALTGYQRRQQQQQQ